MIVCCEYLFTAIANYLLTKNIESTQIEDYDILMVVSKLIDKIDKKLKSNQEYRQDVNMSLFRKQKISTIKLYVNSTPSSSTVSENNAFISKCRRLSKSQKNKSQNSEKMEERFGFLSAINHVKKTLKTKRELGGSNVMLNDQYILEDLNLNLNFIQTESKK